MLFDVANINAAMVGAFAGNSRLVDDSGQFLFYPD
jgi:hypothetical protein